MQPPPARSQAAIAVASLRARQWWYFCLLPLAGASAAQITAIACWPRLSLAALAAAGCLACAYGLNAVAERVSDRSEAKNPLVTEPSAARAASTAAVLAGALAVLLAAGLGPRACAAAAVSLICGVTYSLGPRGKHFPGIGLILNTGIFVPLTALLLDGSPTPPSWAREAALFTLLLLQNQLIHELADLDEDRAAGAATTAAWLGPTGTRIVILGLCAVTPVVALVLGADALALVLTSMVAIAAARLATQAKHEPERARVRHRWLSLAGGCLVWLLARVAHG